MENLETIQRQLLNVAIANKTLGAKIFTEVEPEYFTDRYRVIYRRARDQFLAGKELSLATIYDCNGTEEAIKGLEIEDWKDACDYSRETGIWSSTVDDSIKLLRNRFTRTRIAELGSLLISLSKHPQEETQLINQALRFVEERLSIRKDRNRMVEHRASCEKTMERIEKQKASGKTITGLPTGYLRLNGILHGFQPASVNILYGSTGRGKTALALNILHRISVMGPVKSLYLNLEMDSGEIENRLLALAGDLPLTKIRTAEMTDEEMVRLSHGIATISSNSKIIISPPGENTIDEVIAICQMAKIQKGIEFIVIDHIGEIQGYDNEKGWTRLDKIMGRIRGLAIATGCPILVLGQLNRGAEMADDVGLEHSAGSYPMNSKADSIMAIGPESTKGKDDENYVLSVMKNRHGGGERKVYLIFDKKRIAFIEKP